MKTKRYDNRYEERFSETQVLCLHQLPTRIWKCRAADRILTKEPGEVSSARHRLLRIITIPTSILGYGNGDDSLWGI